MKFKKKIKILFFFILILFVAFIIPFIINILYKHTFNIWWLATEWKAADTLLYYGSIITFIGTTVLGFVSYWQTKKANDLSEKLLKNSLIESTTIPQLQNKFDIESKENNDAKITFSAHHKLDYGAIIAMEQWNNNIKRLNQHLLNLYFKCSGKGSNIKCITISDILCVQDPSEGGLMWGDNSDDPIPLGLHLGPNNKAYLNWISDDEFFIQLKVYCEPKQCFDSMIKNEADLCLMFDLVIENFNGIKTKMSYKIWLEKFQGINVKKTNSTFEEIINN